MIKQDVFPAIVAVAPATHETPVSELKSTPTTAGALRLSSARVIVTEYRIIIAQDSATGPMVVFDEPITTHFKSTKDKTKDSYVVTANGTKVAFQKDGQCGCGARLRSWRPFKSMGSINDPTS